MRSALAAGEAFVMLLPAVVLFEAVEALGRVEVELVPPDGVLQAEEALHLLQLRVRVAYQLICARDVSLVLLGSFNSGGELFAPLSSAP